VETAASDALKDAGLDKRSFCQKCCPCAKKKRYYIDEEGEKAEIIKEIEKKSPELKFYIRGRLGATFHSIEEPLSKRRRFVRSDAGGEDAERCET
jgi:hypothetical protein